MFFVVFDYTILVKPEQNDRTDSHAHIYPSVCKACYAPCNTYRRTLVPIQIRHGTLLGHG
jgi:hypothetical protein